MRAPCIAKDNDSLTMNDANDAINDPAAHHPSTHMMENVADSSAATNSQFLAAFDQGVVHGTQVAANMMPPSTPLAGPSSLPAVQHNVFVASPAAFAPHAAVVPLSHTVVSMPQMHSGNADHNNALWMSPTDNNSHIFQQQATAAAAAAAAATSPSEMTAQSPRPTFVNAKQYRRILKRREARARLEEYCRQKRVIDMEEGKRKPYQHESRHRHAKKRPRGPGGRFLTKEELVDYYKQHPEQEDPSHESSSPSGDESIHSGKRSRGESQDDPLDALL